MKKILMGLMCVLLLCGCSNKTSETNTNELIISGKISSILTKLDDSNSFYTIGLDAANTLLESGTGIIFIGDSDNKDTQNNAVTFNEALSSNDMQAAYVNLKNLSDSEKDNLFNKLSDINTSNLDIDNSKSMLVCVSNGKLLSINYDDSNLSSNIENVKNLQAKSTNVGCEAGCKVE